MKEKIEILFGQQLEKIKDLNLRAKVIEIWVSTAKKAGWQPHELEKIPFTLLTQTKEHQEAVKKFVEKKKSEV